MGQYSSFNMFFVFPVSFSTFQKENWLEKYAWSVSCTYHGTVYSVRDATCGEILVQEEVNRVNREQTGDKVVD